MRMARTFSSTTGSRPANAPK